LFSYYKVFLSKYSH